MNDPVTIRPATSAEVPSLPGIELAAYTLYGDRLEELGLRPSHLELVTQIAEFEEARRAGLLWVAAASDDRPVGFALVREVDGQAHIEELDVHPSHGGRGAGSALLATVCAWARDAGYRWVTLSTFRDVPWNAPFYARRGFRILGSAELSPGLRNIVDIERGKGLRMDLRVMMRFEVDRA